MSTPSGFYILEYGTQAIRYELRFSERRTLAIHVHPDTRVTVDAPEGSAPAQIEEKVRQRAAWIVKQQRDFERYSYELPPREYVSGETHRYLGRQYRLKVLASESGRETVKMDRGRIYVYARDTQNRARVKALLDRWYRRQARRVYAERLEEWFPRCERFGIARPEIVVRKMSARWGSCSTGGKITLNLKLIKLPKAYLDYVLVHELCHLVEHHHGPAFYALLDRVLPDWQERREELNRLEE